MAYNKGPSSWMHTMIVNYDNGCRHLVNIIDGAYPE